MNSVSIRALDGPVITVHKGWAPSKKRGSPRHAVPAADHRRSEIKTFSLPSRQKESPKASLPEEDIPRRIPDTRTTKPRKTGRQLEFVNATEPSHAKDAAVRKLVRSHVMRETARERRVQQKTKLKGVKAKDVEVEAEIVEQARPIAERVTEPLSDVTNHQLISQSRGQKASTSKPGPDIKYGFTQFPTKIGPKTEHLVTLFFSQVAAAIFPMQYHLAYNPIRQVSLVESSMTDNAMFHALLYAAAVCSTLSKGERDSREFRVQMDRTIRYVNGNISGGQATTDKVIGAVACLAMGEALRGNLKVWAIHMAGLKKMVELRGGMDTINTYLQVKLYRADLMGSIDQVTTPFFHFDWSTRPILYNLVTCAIDHRTIHMGLRTLLPRFADVFTELVDFSHVLERTMLTRGATLDTKQFVDACYSIQHQLLPHSDEGREDGGGDVVMAMVDEDLGEVFRLGAILYVKKILQGFTFSATGSRTVVAKLRGALGRLGRRVLVSATAGTWVLFWVHFLGAVASGKTGGDCGTTGGRGWWRM